MESRFGFVREKLEIKILILYILSRLKAPIDFDSLADLTMCDDGISYFDFAECIDELEKTGHIQKEASQYIITNKGIINGTATETAVPYSVRNKAKDSVNTFNFEVERQSNIKTEIQYKLGEFEVSLILSDGFSEILNMKMKTDSEKNAMELEKGFKNKAEKLYNTILKCILE